ncbi:MAG TPA: hypothetical protein VMI56_00090 [Reyranella sp.]|nr:hypothetical protein [Reyranella sp.]
MVAFRWPFGGKKDPKEVFASGLRQAIAGWKEGGRGAFELTGHDALVTLVTHIAGGIAVKDVTDVREPLLALLGKYFANTKAWMDDSATLAGNPERAAHAIYRDIQRTLMAYRSGDFVSIQAEPQFSRRTHGKAALVAMLDAYLGSGEKGLEVALDEIIGRGSRGARDDAPIEVSGGTGSSMPDAVVIHTADEDGGVDAEYWYLSHAFGRIRRRGQSLQQGRSGRHYDCITFGTEDGRSHSVYFDISEFYGSGRVGDAARDGSTGFICPHPGCTIRTPHDH